MKKWRADLVVCICFIFLLLAVSVFFTVTSVLSPGAFGMEGLQSPRKDHLFGTDFLGRDILGRTLSAAWLSVLIGVLSRSISVAVGLAVGIPAALLPGKYERVLNSIIEIFMAIPALLLAMALSVVMGERYITIFIAIAAGTWAPVARFTSVQVRQIARLDYVIASRALGAGRFRIIFRHIMPAFLPTLIPTVTSGIAAAIMIESTLSFLGLGGGMSVNQVPTWGKLINEGSKFIFDAPWLILPPAIFLTLTVLVFNRIGDVAADRSIRQD